MLRQAGDVRAVNDDLAAVDLERARNGVQHSRLPCPVAADDSDEIAVVQGQIQVIQRRFGVDRTGVEGFADIDKLKHGAIPPFWLFHGTFLPFQNGIAREERDQGRDELEVVRVQAELQHDLEHKVIDHSADGHGQKLETEIREQACRR